MHYTDVLILCLYFLISLSLGLLKKQAGRTLQSFTFYKNISLPALVCIVFSSTIGAGSSIGVIEDIYSLGLAYVAIQCLQPLCWLIAANIIAPSIERFKDCLTISDVMGKLYGKPAEVTTSVMAVVMCLGSLSMQAIVLGQVLNYFFGIEHLYGTSFSYLIIVIYSISGGIRAVVYNDIFKVIILLFILPITCVVAGINVGSVERVFSSLPTSHMEFEFNEGNILLLASALLYSLLPSFDAKLMQRYLMTRDSKQLRQSLYWISFFVLIFAFSITGVAYIVQAFASDTDVSLVFPYFINNFLPVGVKGLMIAGLVAVVMSMAEANLNSGGLIVYRNCLSYFLPKYSERTQLNIFRCIICITAACSIIIVNIAAIGIYDLFFIMRNFWDTIICIPATAGFLGFKTNSKTFIASTACAVVSVLIGRLYAGEFATVSLMFGIIGCTIGFFAMHYLQVLYGKLPKQVIHIINGKALIQNFKYWKEGLYADYARYANEEPRYNTFLYLVYIFLALSGGHITWYSTQHITLAFLWGTIHMLCIPLALRECLFVTPWLQKIMPTYFKITLLMGLPVFSSYILLTFNGSNFWAFIGAFSAICIIHIVDSLRAITYFTTGLCFAILLKILIGETDLHNMSLQYIPLIYSYFFFISYGVVRNREYEQEEKLEGMQVFAGIMAHEVKTPLAAINMCAESIKSIVGQAKKSSGILGSNTLKFDKNHAETLITMSDLIFKVSKHGVRTVDTLLMSIRKKILVAEKSVCIMAALVREVVSEYNELQDREHNIIIEVRKDFALECSEIYMKQILFNLLTNTFKYGGQKLEVKICIDNGTIYFEDNGAGIPESKLPYIFKKFYTSSRSGTGLGLSFCKMAIEAMGGTITCESKEGQYTRFIMTYVSAQVPSFAEINPQMPMAVST